MKATFLVVIVTMLLIALVTSIDPDLGARVFVALAQPLLWGIKLGLAVRGFWA